MKELSGEEIVLLASSAAINIAKETDNDELTLLSDFFTLLGQALLTIGDRRNIDKASAQDNIGTGNKDATADDKPKAKTVQGNSAGNTETG